MSMPPRPPGTRRISHTLKAALRPALACALGVAGAVALVACGSSSKGLISAAAAGPLKNDVEAVLLAAQEGNGSCTTTNAALQRTEQDFAALPSTVNSGLRDTLRQGIKNLRKVASELCIQPSTRTTTTPSTPTTSEPTTKTTAPAEEREKEEKEKQKEEKAKEEESEAAPGAGGGTPAPGETKGKSPGEGAGGVPVEETPATGAGGQEPK